MGSVLEEPLVGFHGGVQLGAELVSGQLEDDVALERLADQFGDGDAIHPGDCLHAGGEAVVETYRECFHEGMVSWCHQNARSGWEFDGTQHACP